MAKALQASSHSSTPLHPSASTLPHGVLQPSASDRMSSPLASMRSPLSSTPPGKNFFVIVEVWNDLNTWAVRAQLAHFWLQSIGGFFPPITKDFLSYWRASKTLRHINTYIFKLLLIIITFLHTFYLGILIGIADDMEDLCAYPHRCCSREILPPPPIGCLGEILTLDLFLLVGRRANN
jgi:hypothetical protein